MSKCVRASSVRRLVLETSLAATLAGALSLPAKADPFSEFVYCAPPARPGCIDKNSAPQSACEDQVEMYVTSVFKYRECLEHEMERAVREANKAIADVKCRSDRGDCRR